VSEVDTGCVAVIGAIGVHKGFNVLKACAQDAKRRGLPLRFVVIGYTRDDAQFRALDNVVITGAYERTARRCGTVAPGRREIPPQAQSRRGSNSRPTQPQAQAPGGLTSLAVGPPFRRRTHRVHGHSN
jgi:hypothetical protein